MDFLTWWIFGFFYTPFEAVYYVRTLADLLHFEETGPSSLGARLVRLLCL